MLDEDPLIDLETYEYWASGQGFYLALQSTTLMPEEEIVATFADNELEFDDFDYRITQHWHRFWIEKLEAWPGMADQFRHYLDVLQTFHVQANQHGLELAQIYVLVDPLVEGSLTSIYLLESPGWFEATAPGDELLEEERTCPGWVDAIFPESEGDDPTFGHARIADPCRGFLPRFERDEWGVWFGSWKTGSIEVDGADAIAYIGVDFSAARVVELMVVVAGSILVVVGTLIALVLLTTRRYSRWLSQPINALRDGATAVSSGDLRHVVPQFSLPEFHELTDSFNRMVSWTRERLNLKDTMTKLLSEELAESAANEGLSLGGEERECTIMFTDFAGFSTLTKSLPAATAVELLNEYFSVIVPIIEKHGGFPDKYVGDVFIGAIGCDAKLEYTSIGEVTNRANRIEARCEIGHAMMSRYTFELVKDQVFDGVLFDKRPRALTVKGYDYPVDWDSWIEAGANFFSFPLTIIRRLRYVMGTSLLGTASLFSLAPRVPDQTKHLESDNHK